MICLSLMEKSIKDNLKTFKKYQNTIDMVELRLDMLDDPTIFSPSKIKNLFSVPIIITFRRKIDGGNFKGTEMYRRLVLYEFSKNNFEYIDLEIDTNFSEVEQEAHLNGIRIIRSYHNFIEVPENLENVIRSLSKKAGEIPKVAVYPNNSKEALELFKVIDSVTDIKEKIVIGMGEYGIPSRILYKRLGSILSFCSVKAKLAAPGQLSPEEMDSVYHTKKINKSTLVFGIIGNPVMHSLSPKLHNYAYSRGCVDAVYLPFKVDDIAAFFNLAKILSIKGFSVTIPYKINILEFLDKISPEIKTIKSCNTVLREGNCWKGFNTDQDGFLTPLLPLLNGGNFKNAAIIGAGGAARAIISALSSCNIKLTIFNRTVDKGEKLAFETGTSFLPLTNAKYLNNYDIIIQTTNVGMSPYENRSPVPDCVFRKGQIVYDIIYKPEKTKFLKEAEKASAIILNGAAMLQAQGIKQYEIFIGQPFPFESKKLIEEQKENS